MKEVEKLLKLGEDLKIIKTEEFNNEKLIYVESRKKKVRCPKCNKFTKSIHGHLKPIKIKDLKIEEHHSKLIITKRRFKCYNCNKIFTEQMNINDKNKSISEKLRIKVLQDLLDYNLSLKWIGLENNIDENTVRHILEDAMKNHPDYVRLLPRVISIDEFKADTNEGKYACIINDPIHKKALDILPNRKKEYLIQYFTHCENRHSVEVVISDMYEPYLLVTQTMFPKAIYVVDPFHYITYIMDALDKIRIRLQKEYGPKSKEYKLLKNKKNVSLIRNYSIEIDWWTYTKRYKNGHMVEVLKYDLKEQILKINIDLQKGYELKELFLDIVNHATIDDCKKQFLCWIDLCRESEIEEFISASNTIENWLEQICNSFIDERYSNGYTEGTNNLIKVIKRVGFGYRNFKFFRMRLLYILNNKDKKISNRVKNKNKKVKNATSPNNKR